MKDANGTAGFEYLGSLIYTRTGTSSYSLESTDFGGGRINKVGSSFTANYHITDHLGSVRVVFTSSSNVIARNDYYPFGKRHVNSLLPTSTTNRHLFNGKENQTTGNLKFLDYGARMYSPEYVRWFSIDQLAEKYYRWSTYVYALNNPIKFLDPDGRKVYFAPGVSEQFKVRFAATVQYMNSKGTSGGLAKLERSSNVYYIQEGEGSFNHKTNTIHWNPAHIIGTDNGNYLFPATVLSHEIGHANQKEGKSSQQFYKDLTTEASNPYDNKLEEENIKGVEQDAALKHGDIKPGGTTRFNHRGKLINIENMPDEKILEEFEKNKIRSKLDENQ